MNKKQDIFGFLKEVSEKIQILEQNFKKAGYQPTIAFRGESKDYGKTKLMPSMFRDKHIPNYKELSINQENELFNLIDDYKISVSADSSSIEKAIEAQHYLGYSRLLDISFSVLSAIFFACESEKNEDGKLYIFAFPEMYSPSSEYIKNYFKDVYSRSTNIFSRNFKPISHNFFNNRIQAQSGGFIIFDSKNFFPLPKIYYEELSIDSALKDIFLDNLEDYFNISYSSIFPEKDKMGNHIKKKVRKQNLNLPKTPSTDYEVIEFLRKIELEIKIEFMDKTLENSEKIKLLRYLRKYEKDVLEYMSTEVIDENYRNLSCEKVKDFFSLLRQQYHL